MSKAVAIEMEHSKKVGSAENTARICVIIEPKLHDSEAPRREKVEPQTGKMWAALEAVHADLAVVKETMARKTTSSSQCGSNIRVNQRCGCASYQENGLGDRCNHCFTSRIQIISLVVAAKKSNQAGERETAVPKEG